MATTDRAFFEQASKLIDFMNSRLGHFRVDGGVPYFKSSDDVSSYNAMMPNLTKLATEEEHLERQQKQFAQQQMDEFARIFKAQ